MKADKNKIKKVRVLITEAGSLQRAVSKAALGYKEIRAKLASELEAVAGEDKYLRGHTGEYQAILSHDEYYDVDVIAVVKQFNNGHISKAVLRKILSVKIGEAKKLLPAKLGSELMKRKMDEEVTLHISKTESDDE